MARQGGETGWRDRMARALPRGSGQPSHSMERAVRRGFPFRVPRTEGGPFRSAPYGGGSPAGDGGGVFLKVDGPRGLHRHQP
eukprot:9499115-Pyramimonas_sp.AAC.1